jgi:hypothetical protein
MSLVDEARTVRERIVTRLGELAPLVREYDELSAVAIEMGLEVPSGEVGPGGPDARGNTAVPEASEPELGAGAARRRPPARTGSASRSQRVSAPEPEANTADHQIGKRVLETVRSEPGKTVAQYAGLLGVSASSLYRPVRELTNDGALVKRARQLFPA